MKRISYILKNSGIRSRLIVAYIILLSIPMCVIGIRYYITTKNMIYDITQKNVHKIVKKNNEFIDAKLKRVRDNCWELMSDSEFIEKSSSMEMDDYKTVSMDIELTKILNKYFMSSQDISSAQLITSYYAFGYSATLRYDRNYIPISSFKNSELYSRAVRAKGELEWFPTYNFAEMFKQPNIEGNNSQPKYMFSAIQHIKTANMRFKNKDGNGYTTESPVLIINFDEEFYHSIFKSSITMKDSYFFVITKDGQIISHQDRNKIGKRENYPWLKEIYKNKSGQEVVKIDGKKTLICYDTIKETDWISVIAIDNDSLLEDIISSIKINSVYVVIILTIIAILISYFVSYTITKPITRLSKAIKKTGDGDFNIKVSEQGSVEFSNLINRFNSMNEKIQKLIQENYEIKIKEKEAEINALTLQLDPHFMYNTLNMINLKLIQNGEDEVSEIIMSLSAMLKFNARNKSTLVPFEQEMDYLKGYIYIMSKRFEGKFSVEHDIDPELYQYSVPKFLLQPFVENSLIHGFDLIKKDCILRISCSIDGENRLFVIEDNGNGMSEEKIREIMEGRTNSVGISNVRNRIQIIYDGKYDIYIQSKPLEGTKITICLPVIH